MHKIHSKFKNLSYFHVYNHCSLQIIKTKQYIKNKIKKCKKKVYEWITSEMENVMNLFGEMEFRGELAANINRH